ncbi:restriction endonuclease subunit S [Leisingera sp. JC1]|uniref:restriction endonuclease subunit S n=1 Tax=Leisingera sp. JC1 TaxID=1855282 RepID=UPI000803724B|nr:restriction endonuclease subunit S [Leisingera sp. JC1]OBY24380.1 hypothetical protein A9D60_24420 [Leisingera sp. JC1]
MTASDLVTDTSLEKPDEWPMRTAASFNPFITSGSRGWAKYYADHGDLFMRITNLKRHRIKPDLSDRQHVALPASEKEGLRTGLRNGDILISITADIGIIGYVDENVPTPAYINQHVACLRLPADQVSPKFVAYYLASSEPQRRFIEMTDVGAKTGINLTTVGKLTFPCPPLVEQEAIAEALSDADALIEGLERLIAKKRLIKQGAMQDLLTAKRRLPGFSGEWDVVCLKELVISHNSGVYKKADLYGRGSNIVGVSDIHSVDCIDGRLFKRVPLTNDEKKKCTLSAGDLLYAESSLVKEGIARTVYVSNDGEDTCFAWHTRRYSVDNQRIRSDFLCYFLQTHASRKHMIDNCIQTAITGINTVSYFACPISIPTIPEQTCIAEILTDMDAEIQALETRLEKARQVKEGMMQNLLTGRIRLV